MDNGFTTKKPMFEDNQFSLQFNDSDKLYDFGKWCSAPLDFVAPFMWNEDGTGKTVFVFFDPQQKYQYKLKGYNIRFSADAFQQKISIFKIVDRGNWNNSWTLDTEMNTTLEHYLWNPDGSGKYKLIFCPSEASKYIKVSGFGRIHANAFGLKHFHNS